MDSQFPAILIQTLEYYDVGVGLDILGVELKRNRYRAAGVLRSEGDFRAHLLTVYFQRLTGSLIHKHTLDNVLLAGNQMGVFYYIFQGKYLSGVDFLLAANTGGSTQLRHFIVDNCNFNNLLVPLYLHMVDIGVGQIALGRLQFPDDPVVQRDILKGEHTILI